MHSSAVLALLAGISSAFGWEMNICETPIRPLLSSYHMYWDDLLTLSIQAPSMADVPRFAAIMTRPHNIFHRNTMIYVTSNWLTQRSRAVTSTSKDATAPARAKAWTPSRPVHMWLTDSNALEVWHESVVQWDRGFRESWDMYYCRWRSLGEHREGRRYGNWIARGYFLIHDELHIPGEWLWYVADSSSIYLPATCVRYNNVEVICYRRGY